MAAVHIDLYTLEVDRICQECRQPYRIRDFAESNEHYFHKPERYIDGCEQFCLACWLGVGPNDAEDADSQELMPAHVATEIEVAVPHYELRHGWWEVNWPYAEIYEGFVGGNLTDSYQWFFDSGWHLAVLPLTRVKILNPIFFPNGGAIFPPQVAQILQLNPKPNCRESMNRAEVCSAVSGIDVSTFERHPAVVLPCRFDWEAFVNASHDEQLGLVRALSELVDRTFLNFMRYWKCCLDSSSALPSRAGQTNGNPRMAGALFYNARDREARIVGGAAFSHAIVDGLGMSMTQPEWNQIPLGGEVGTIADHGLRLYSNLLEASSQTARFMQAVALLEFLAFPWEYHPLKKVRAVIVRQASSTPQGRELMTARIRDDLFGPEGLRTKIVHGGHRLEELLSQRPDRDALFRELDGYVRALIDDMTLYSEMPWADYAEQRKQAGGHLADDD